MFCNHRFEKKGLILLNNLKKVESLLNQRLKVVASLIDESCYMIDVGCDHALLDIYLASIYKNIKIIASDNKKGPLEGAKENIKKYHLETRIQLKLGNGIDPIEKKVDTIVISGMGGLNMIGILKYKKELLFNIKTIILSPNSDTEKVRKEMIKLGYIIENEQLVKDKHIIYPVLVLKKGKKHYSKQEYLFGPILLERKDTLFLEYIKNERTRKEKSLEILPKKYIQRRRKLKKELKMIKKNL